MAWESHSEKEMIISKVIFEISRKNDVHNNYETDYSTIDNRLGARRLVHNTIRTPDVSYINHKNCNVSYTSFVKYRI